MNFDLSEEQRAYVDLAREFSDRELAPHAARWDAEAFFPVDTIRKAGALGFCGLYSDPACGGLGLGRLDAHLVFEQLARGCTATTAYLTIHNMCAWMVTRFASDALRAQVGPRLTSGEWLASYCLTEPNAGSDAAQLQTRAERDGDHYEVSGTKVFISGASRTDLLVVMVRTGGAGARGISCLAIPADSPGISYGRQEDKMGWNCQPTRAIHFDRVRVPVTHRIGEEGEGFALAMKGLDGGRINIATCSLGTAQAALELARNHLAERRQFGQAIGEFQGLQFKLADMATRLVAARQMVRLAAFRLDTCHAEATLFCAMAKQFATDAGFAVCNDALQLFGGYGYIREYPLERFVRDTRVHQILEGTNEIMRHIIARRLKVDGLCEVLQ